MNKWQMKLTWSLCASLVVSLGSVVSAVFAQEPHPLQMAFEGLWTEDNNTATETEEQRLFITVAESNLRDPGEAFRASYRPEANSAASCPMAGALAGEAANIEIVDRGDGIDIVAFGRTRHVYMDFWREPPDTFVPNTLGWSTGRWAGDMLVIRTTRLTEGVVKSGERPLPFGGPIAQMVERYTLSEDHSRLSVDINLNDPKYYTFSINVRHNYVRTDEILRGTECMPG